MANTFDLTSFPSARNDATEDKWTKYAQALITNGVLSNVANEMQVFADSTGMIVKVKTGRCFIDGVAGDLTTQQSLDIGAADPTNPRLDRVVARLTTTSPATVAIKVIPGLAASSPTAPALLDDATHTDIPLAIVRVELLAGTITAGKVTDARTWVQPGSDPNNRLELRGDQSAIVSRDGSGTTKWLSGTRLDIAGNVNDYVVYGYANGKVRFYSLGDEFFQASATATYALNGLYVGENIGAWGYRGLRVNPFRNETIQVVNSAFGNPNPYVDIGQSDAVSEDYTIRVNISSKRVAIGASVAMTNASSHVLGLSDVPAANPGNPSSGGYLFSEAGALKWKGPAGTITTVAPA